MQTLRKLFICLALAATVLIAPGLAHAQSFKWWQMERFQKELSLTPEQIDKLEGIFQGAEPSLRSQKAAVDKHEHKLSKVVSDLNADESMVLLAADRLEAARAELNRTRTLLLFRHRRVLTDEQHHKLNQMSERDRKPKGNSPHSGGCP